jgi:AcrR family transcriptional regulator
MRRRMTREEQKARTRADLIEAAARVFARKGYRAATVDDVAEEAGFTKGAYYANFKSKDDVFMALVADRSRNWTMAVAGAYAGNAPLSERLHRGGEVLTRMLEEESEWMLLSNEMWSHSIRHADLRRQLAEAYAECREVIAASIRSAEHEWGVDMSMPAEHIAALTIALTDGFVLQRLADPDRLPSHLLADGVNLFLSGVMRPGSTPA